MSGIPAHENALVKKLPLDRRSRPTREGRARSNRARRRRRAKTFLVTEKPEIVGITETWIHTNTRDFEGEFEIPGYKTFKKDRLDREGGGVMLYVRGHLDPVECKIDRT